MPPNIEKTCSRTLSWRQWGWGAWLMVVLASIFGLSAQAGEIRRIVDPKGNVYYTNEPPEQSALQPVAIQAAQIAPVSAPSVTKAAAPATPASAVGSAALPLNPAQALGDWPPKALPVKPASAP